MSQSGILPLRDPLILDIGAQLMMIPIVWLEHTQGRDLVWLEHTHTGERP